MRRFSFVILPLLLALAVILSPMLAHAQTVPGTATLTWTVVGAPTGIEVHWSTSPIPDEAACALPCAGARAAQAVLTGAPSTSTQTLQVTNGQRVYFRLKATDASGRSAFSNQGDKVIVVPTLPSAPTSLTIQLVIQPVAP